MVGKLRRSVERQIRSSYGFLPTLAQEIATSQPLAQIYAAALGALREGSLTRSEQEAVLLTVAAWYRTTYCAALHRTLAQRTRLTQQDIDHMTGPLTPSSHRLGVLVRVTRTFLETDCEIAQAVLEEFKAEGVEIRQVLEIIALVGVATMEVLIEWACHLIPDAQLQPQVVAFERSQH